MSKLLNIVLFERKLHFLPKSRDPTMTTSSVSFKSNWNELMSLNISTVQVWWPQSLLTLGYRVVTKSRKLKTVIRYHYSTKLISLVNSAIQIWWQHYHCWKGVIAFFQSLVIFTWWRHQHQLNLSQVNHLL